MEDTESSAKATGESAKQLLVSLTTIRWRILKENPGDIFPLAITSFTDYDPVEDTESIIPTALRRPRHCVSLTTIRWRILKVTISPSMPVLQLSFTDYDPVEDTESLLVPDCVLNRQLFH